MDNSTIAFRLLSLFSTKQRAIEIEGDLLEESEHRGRFWFITHVLRVTLALFRESLTEAPCRIAALGVTTTGLAILTCGFLDSVFFSPGAFYPAPLLGNFAIPLSAFLTGWGLSYFASSLGVRAAALTTMLLTCLFVFSLIDAGASQISFASELGPIMSVVKVIFSTVMSFALGIALYIAPFMAGSVYYRDFHIAE